MRERLAEYEERLAEYESEMDAVYRLYHVPVLVALMAFMLWLRLRHYGRHLGEDGLPLYRGNDPYYHLRATTYTVENYPYTIPFDPWTGFDAGQRTGQFGTLFDQVFATVALVAGGGSPSQETIIAVTLVAAPVLAALCAIPMYVIGRRLGGRFGGLVAVLVLALSAGQFLTRSVVGTYDHHIGEVFATLCVLVAGMVMVSAAQRDRPIYELLRTRDLEAFESPLKWAIGLAVALLGATLVWPPGVFLFGVIAAFLFVHLSAEFVSGHSPDHVALPTAAALVLYAILFSPFVVSTDLTATDYSILHPIFALAVAAGGLFMAGVARLWESRELSRRVYPVGVAAVGGVGALIVAVALPETFDFFLTQLQRVAGLGTTDTAATIGEAQSPSNPVSFFYGNYGFALYSAIFGFLLLLYRALSADRPRAEDLLIVTFGGLMLLFTLTQIRFDYYLVIAVGAGNAYLVRWVFGFIDLEEVRADVTNIKPYQVLVATAIVFVVAGPLVVTGGAVATADQASQPGEMQQWTESLDWLSDETPEMGTYDTGGEPSLEYYGTYENREDFEYGEGDYGVLAWWDYGHYITSRGERVPVANPFQQHATESADFLLADEEGEAVEILEEDQPEGESVRYVMVDYQLGYAGTSKYNAPTAFDSEHDVDTGDVGIQMLNGQGQILYGAHTQRGYESMRVRLYQFHGSARDPGTLTLNVSQYNPESGYARLPEGATTVNDLFQQHESPEAAAEAADGNPTVIHGGILGQPAERVEALEHFRLVHAGGPRAQSPFDRIVPGQTIGGRDSWVKTFERVEGARVEGEAPENTEVQASVEMEINATGETFTYVQYAQTDDQGNFNMTVPYSTTGYDEYSPENGHTNVDVRANGSYQFAAPTEAAFGSANVTEAQVLGDDDEPVTVELENPFETTPDGNTTSDNGTTDVTTDNTTEDDSTDGATDSSETGGGSADNSTDSTARVARVTG